MRLRTVLTLLLGLVFLAEGTAALAAPWKTAHAAAAPMQMPLQMPSQMDGSAHCMKSHSPSGKTGCCTPACPDMANCALSSIAAAPASALALLPAPAETLPAPGITAPVRVTTFLLRPPITAHG